MDKAELKRLKKLLVENGFIDSRKKEEFNERMRRSGEKDKLKFIKSLKDEAADFADVEKREVNRLEPPVETDYPAPANSYRMILESANANIEEIYFWFYHHLRYDQGFHNVVKISDIFTASEMSSLSGTLQYRIAQQQEKAAGYLRGISEMVKSLFQIVREIRVLNEKIMYYDDSRKSGEPGKNAEIALKGQWVDLVEGGAKSPASVYGLAQQVGFVTLPDLFFRVKVDKTDDIGKEVEKLEFNPKVKEVLTRKLYQYYAWKEKTESELKTRRAFVLKYLRQHYNTIKLYMGWIKPYLKTIRRMGQGSKNLESAEIISAFETSKIELEILTSKPPIGDYYPVIIATFHLRTTPQMSFQSEGYQKGPIHLGQVELFLRSYVWTSDQIEGYKKYREAEDLELLRTIDETINQTMDALGDEFRKYLEMEGEIFEKQAEEKKKERSDSAFEPFTALFSGFGDLFGGVFPGVQEIFSGEKKKKEKSEWQKDKDKGGAKGAIDFSLYQSYKNFKKSHGYIAW